MNQNSNRIWRVAVLLLTLCAVHVLWMGATRVCAADLVVPDGGKVVLSGGSYTYSKAQIYGELVLQGNTTITLTYCKDNPDKCWESGPTVLDLQRWKGQIRCDVVDGEWGKGAENPGESGGNGGNGRNGCNLTMIVHGHAYLNNGSTGNSKPEIDLHGGAGGRGGSGMYGKASKDAECGGDEPYPAASGTPGGNGGQGGHGGNGGNLNFTVYGGLSARMIYLLGGDAGNGGDAGSGVKGGDGCISKSAGGPVYQATPPTPPGTAGNGGVPGRSGSAVILANTVSGSIYANPGRHGGHGKGGNGGNCGEGGSVLRDDGQTVCISGTPGLPGGWGASGKEGLQGGNVFVQSACAMSSLTVNANGETGGGGNVPGFPGEMPCGPCDPKIMGINGIQPNMGLTGGPGGTIFLSATDFKGTLWALGGQGGGGGTAGASGYGCPHDERKTRGSVSPGATGGSGGSGGKIQIRAVSVHSDTVANVNAGEGGYGGLGACCNCSETEGCQSSAKGEAGQAGSTGNFQKALVSAQALRPMTAVDKAQAKTGDPIEYTVSVSAAQSHTNVKLSFSVPDGVTLTEISGTYSISGGVVTWTLPSLSACQFQVFTVKAVVDAFPGEILSASSSVSSAQQSALQQSNQVETFIEDMGPDVSGVRLTSKLGSSQDDFYTSDPVNPSIGNYVFSKELFSYPGKGIPFSFAVTYNSRDTSYNGPLGPGWNHKYHVTVINSGSEYTIKWGDGHENFFKRDDQGVYTPFDCHTTVSLRDVSGGGHEAVLENGIIYRFDELGRLIRITDANDNQITLSHSEQMDQITDTAGRAIQFTYMDGQMTTVKGPLATLSFAYDETTGDLTGITDSRGNTRRFTYDAGHRLLTYTDRKGQRIVSNTYDGMGRLTGQVDPAGEKWIYEYDDSSLTGTTVQIVPPGGTSVTHWYDKAFNLKRVMDAAGGKAFFTYDDQGRRLSATDKHQNTARFTYNAAGLPSKIADRTGSTTQVDYNGFNLPTQIKDGMGKQTTMSYDTKGNLTQYTDPTSATTQITYGAAGLPSGMKDALGRQWFFVYNTQGLMTTKTDPLGNQTIYAYDAAGRLTSVDLPGAGLPLKFTYDANGNLKTRTDALGNVTSLTYDPNDNPVQSLFEPSGALTQYTYTASNQVKEIKDGLGAVMLHTYSKNGDLTSFTDPDGVKLSYGYDSRSQLLTETSASGGVFRYGYDTNGNMVSVTDPLNHTWGYGYDTENRQLWGKNPLGGQRSFSYDSLGRVTATTDALGLITRYEYDAAGQMVKEIRPDGSTLLFQYDLIGNRTQLTDPLGRSWRFTYDAMNRLSRTVDPAGAGENYAYDGMGRLVKTTTRKGEQILSSYDANGQLTSVTLPGQSPMTYGYDAAGNLATATTSSGTTEMTHDKRNRLVSLKDVSGKTLGYGYTPAGRLSSITYPGGFMVQYAYDTSGRLSTIMDGQNRKTRYTYDAANRVTRIDLPNGTQTLHAYDADGRPTSLTHQTSTGTVLAGYTYTYNAAGMETAEKTTPPVQGQVPTGQTTWTYNSANRMLTATTSGVATNFTFDMNGNLLKKQSPSGSVTFGWDALNRLVSVQEGVNLTTYIYDGTGNRIAKTFNGTRVNYLKESGKVYAKYNPAGTVLSHYVYGVGPLVYSVDNAGSIRVYHTDTRGSVVAITDESQKVIQAYDYDPYGKAIATTGNIQDEFRYLGYHGVMTDENNLIHMGARYYDPVAGRFLSEDPLGVSEGANLYAYAEDDPINRMDPSGLKYEWMYQNDNYAYWLGRIKRPVTQKVYEVSQTQVGLNYMGEVSYTAVENYEKLHSGGFIKTAKTVNVPKYPGQVVKAPLGEGASVTKKITYQVEKRIGQSRQMLNKANVFVKELPHTPAGSYAGNMTRGFVKGGVRVAGKAFIVYVLYDTAVTSYAEGRRFSSEVIVYDMDSHTYKTTDQKVQDDLLPLFLEYYEPDNPINSQKYYECLARKELKEFSDDLKRVLDKP